ncbi:DUF2846 domain-containing protein [Gammaproteobacteria bacterium LSUCC0057]|uniref:DUF2846 domain-containing protein n=1 Tax=Gammaproteobacteria bacterium LSUCC0057 TaxID=2559237 RepID=A0A4Y8UGJ1_9GAMM|nr:DUF2846 domain-containing protein [Gammaproteobacteria bacterium LSUCC0057]
MFLLKPSSLGAGNSVVVLLALFLLLATGCASVPMANLEEDASRKEFSAPEEGKAGLYIYRNSHFGAAVKKNIYVNQKFIGQTAPMVYHYIELDAGEHIVSTESEFGNNDILLKADSGVNYFVKTFIKMGLIVAGADLKQVDEEEGKRGVLASNLAR